MVSPSSASALLLLLPAAMLLLLLLPPTANAQQTANGQTGFYVTRHESRCVSFSFSPTT